MSKVTTLSVAITALVLPSMALADGNTPPPPKYKNHGDCVSTFNATYKPDPKMSESQNAQARNAARAKECDAFKGGPAEKG